MIDINELSKERKQLQKRKQNVYKNILKKIYNKIKLANKLNNYCYYVIPNFVLGMPLFDVNKCSDYIYDNLVNKGFKVTRMKYNHFMIYWGHVDSNNNHQNNVEINDDYSTKKTEYRNITDLTNNHKNFIYDI